MIFFPKQSLFFVTLPKSGTDFTWNTLANVSQLKLPPYLKPKEVSKFEGGYYPWRKKYIGVGDFSSQLLNERGVKQYVGKNYVFGAHMAGSYYNIQALLHAGINKTTVLMRDPRDAMVSWVHHVKKAGEGIRPHVSLFQYLPKGFTEWPHKDQVHFHVRTFLPDAVNWVESWLGAVEENGHGLDIQIKFFDQLKHDPHTYFEDIFSYHGIKKYDLSKIELPEWGTRHFRRGKHDQWIEELSTEDQSFVSQLIEGRLISAFDRAGAAHKGNQRASKYEGNGDFMAAANCYLSVIQQFPHYSPAFYALCKSLTAAGNPLPNDAVVSMRDFIKKSDNYFMFPLEDMSKITKHVNSFVS